MVPDVLPVALENVGKHAAVIDSAESGAAEIGKFVVQQLLNHLRLKT
jgi:hypothetical protein